MATGYGGKDREDRYGGKDREDRYDKGDRYDRQGKGDRYGEHRSDNRGDGDDRRGNRDDRGHRPKGKGTGKFKGGTDGESRPAQCPLSRASVALIG